MVKAAVGGELQKIHTGTTPEPVHKQIYSTLEIPVEVTKPRQPWGKVPK